MFFKKIFLCSFGAFLVMFGCQSFAQNVQVFVRHDVADYKVWKKGYDDFAPEQRKGGVYFQQVYQSIDNPNNVTVIHDFHSLEKAKSFFSSEELKSTMKRIGALGKPEIWYVRLDKGQK